MINILMTIINLTMIGSIVAIITIIFRFVFKNKIPKVFVICLWCIVFIKFILLINIPSPMSIFNSLDTETATKIIQDTILYTNADSTSTDSTLTIHNSVKETNETDQVQVKASAQTQANMPLRLNLVNLLGVIWLCGMLLFLLTLIFIYFQTITRFKTAQLIKGNDQINFWLYNINVKRQTKVYTSINVRTPLVFGILKPKIILPIDFDFTNELTLEHILTHELQHIKQFDNLTNIFILIMLCIHWFNPLAWICYLLYRRDIESFCDERVLRFISEGRKSEYATSLLNVAQYKQKLSPFFICSFHENSVKQRVRTIMRFKKFSILSVGIAIILLSSSLIVLASSKTNTIEDTEIKGVLTNFSILLRDVGSNDSITGNPVDMDEARKNEMKQEYSKRLRDVFAQNSFWINKLEDTQNKVLYNTAGFASNVVENGVFDIKLNSVKINEENATVNATINSWQKYIYEQDGKWHFIFLVSKDSMSFELIKESGKWKVLNFNTEGPGANGDAKLAKLLDTYEEALEYAKELQPAMFAE